VRKISAELEDNILFVGYTPKFYKNYQIVNSIISNDLLGELHSSKSFYHSPSPPKDWYFDPDISGGGVIADKLPHLLDFYLDLFGSPESINTKIVKKSNNCPVRSAIEVDFSDVSVEFSIGWNHPKFYSKQILIGEYGHLEFNYRYINGEIRGKPVLFKYGETPAIDLRLKQLYLSPDDDAYKNRMTAFLSSIRENDNMNSNSVEKAKDIWWTIEEIQTEQI
jgi:predicted dehydrogenase